MPHSIGHGKPGKTVRRRPTKGKNKSDTIIFVANKRTAQEPGKLKPRLVVVDRGAKNTTTVPKAKSKKRITEFRERRSAIKSGKSSSSSHGSSHGVKLGKRAARRMGMKHP